MIKPTTSIFSAAAVWFLLGGLVVPASALGNTRDGSSGPLGEWPDFVPAGFITAQHPEISGAQTHLYGDWGAIVGEECLFLQDGLVKLLYHSYHETYLTERDHELNLMDDWALGYDKITKIKHPPLVRTGGPNPGSAWDHTDTPSYIHHPVTGQHLIYNTTRPGTRQMRPEWVGLPGTESSIQVATSEETPQIGTPFFQDYENALEAELWWEQGWNNNGVIKGGLSEPAAVWVPHLGAGGMVRLFYRGLHGASGSYWNWRISYADSEDGKTNWVKKGTPVFDPSDPGNPAYRWTQPPPTGFNFRGSWQAHCTGDVRADGVHMVMTVSNQNYALGGRIAYYWSPDWGDTWFGHPDNPILVPGVDPDGVPDTGFQRTPTLAVDEHFDRYILAYNAGHDADVQWRRRTYLAFASRPADDLSGAPDQVTAGFDFRINSITPNPGQANPRIEFRLPGAGRLRVRVYSVDGRLVDDLGNREVSAGLQAVTWDRTSARGELVPSGVYLVHGALETEGREVFETAGRIVVVQ